MFGHRSRIFWPVAAGILAMTSVAGCTNNPPSPPPESFFSDESGLIQRNWTLQAARGARASATLYPMHFDAGRLNSAGREKLSLMLEDSDCAAAQGLHRVAGERRAKRFAQGRD